MRKTKIGIIIALIMMMAIVATSIASYANNQESIFVNLTPANSEGKGYGIGDPTGEASGEAPYIWNINTYTSSAGTTLTEFQRNLYCIKANYGNSWETVENASPSNVVEYNLSYDLVADKDSILQKLTTDDAGSLVRELLNESNGKYNELLWVLDNIYISGQTDKDAFLDKIGIAKDEDGYYNKETQKMYSYVMTDDDIKAVQKVAIWYFTNGADFDVTTLTDWLNITSDYGETYNALSVSTYPRTEGEERNEQANILYNYLVTEASKNTDYVSPETTTAPVNIKETQNNKINTVRKEQKYLIGPIEIQRNNDLGYDIKIEVSNQDGTILEKTNYTYTDGEGTILQYTTDKELVQNNDEFYVCIDRSLVESVSIKVTITYNTTPKKLWLKGTDGEKGILLAGEQPLVEVTEDPKELIVELTSQPEEFDLVLRKYITAVNGTNVTNTRKPVINEESLLTGTTAIYNHRKEPVVVQDKDEVTYQITIYNEGNKAGYASKIIDQLPTGLINSTSNGTTVVSKDKDGNVKNTYNLQYDSMTSKNQIILTIVDTEENPAQSLNAYRPGNLDCETIEIKCKVAKEPDTKNQIVLTNVAWIEIAYNSEDSKEITITVGEDRDSEPGTKPNVNKDNMEAYKGNVINKEDLSDSEYFYQGEQDDDDFEKLVIMPVEKVFDLALFKHIAAISKDQTIENGEYVTDNGNIDGTYLRAPVVTAIDSVTGKITYEQDDKTALTVEPGDYVLYTIRVYNEGEINGYASKIKDTLPIGLEFVLDNEEYNGIWNLDGLDNDGRQVVSTTWYAKGQGVELDAVEGDPNYKANLLKALNKEDAISEENPDYLDAQVLCRVIEQATSDRVLVNYAQISDDSDENGETIDDIDSTPDEWIDDEDDQDIERIKLQCFDLSLRKFITEINGKALDVSREPVVDVSNLINKTDTTAIYKHSKQPLGVEIGDKIVYTIRVYNEGDINGFASKVTDYLPPYLTYVKDSEINTEYGWAISEDGRIVTTTYLANKEIKAFNGNELDYADLKIECIVSNNTPVKEKQTNIAEISEYTYNGSTVDKDIDSTSDNMQDKIPTDENLPSYKDEELNKDYVPGNEDDDDFEKIYVKEFDLALRKFITEVNGKALEVSREPVVDVSNLINKTDTTAIYKHPKQPLSVKVGDKIVYTIRVYNEGDVDGFASKVTDYLPPYLTYVKDSEINTEYGWTISEDGRVAITTYLANKEIKAFNGKELDYADLKIECIVGNNAPLKQNQTNIAEISEYTYNDVTVDKDRDSTSDNMEDKIPTDENLPSYKDEEHNKDYVPGNEDDDDFEKVYVKEFDLALRKFITQIQEEQVTTRVPQVKIENETITYEHPKDALIVHVGDVVEYTLRIYNEGQLSGYASEITDDIPEYLEYLPENSTNVKYMWKMYDENGNETENVEEAVKVKTTYLSKENGEDNLIKAFDGTTLDYKDIKIAFKVKDPNSNTHIITNHAQISDDTDENGEEIEDKDSKTDEWNEGEDDQDVENVKVQYFDLSLLKFVSKVIVIENGKETITETGYNGHEDPEPVVKVELHKKKLNEVIVKFGYGITITNEGDIAGYATEITDYVPEGLRFDPTDNPEWTDEGNNVISTRQLENTLLQPGQSATIEVIFTWINSPDNLAQKTNTAEISEDKNEYDLPDRDSTPDNIEEEEDDIDIAKVILAITTGAAKTYFVLTLGLLTIVLFGVVLIKKFVI